MWYPYCDFQDPQSNALTSSVVQKCKQGQAKVICYVYVHRGVYVLSSGICLLSVSRKGETIKNGIISFIYGIIPYPAPDFTFYDLIMFNGFF